MYKPFLKSNKALNEETPNYGWWIEIYTVEPLCIYYFGDFDSIWSAALAKNDYIQDLEQEGAVLISICIKLCKPRKITIFEDELEVSDFKTMPSFYNNLRSIQLQS